MNLAPSRQIEATTPRMSGGQVLIQALMVG